MSGSWSNNLSNLIILVVGPGFSGLFGYNPGPGPGNLVFSISTNSGTDPYGNDYLAGFVTYSGPVFAALESGNALFGITADGYPTAGLVGLSGVDALFGSSPTSGANPDSSTWSLVDGDRSVTPQSAAGFPHIELDGTGWVRDSMVKATNSANVWTAETWHAAPFAANWASTGTLNGNSTFRGLSYRKDAEDNCWVLGAALASGAGATIATLPVGYRPPTNLRAMLPGWLFDSSAGTTQAIMAQITEAGALNVAATFTGVTIAAGDQVFINGKFPLGNIA